MTDQFDVPVLIVGGGPAGLTTALWLEQQGIDALLVERRDFTQHFPRAHLLNVRTMEVFHDIGVAEDVYAIAAPDLGWKRVAWYTSLAGSTPLHGRKIGHISAWGGGLDAERYAAASPRKFANLPQIHLDRLLAEHAQRRCGERIRERHELVGLVTDDSGATAEIRDLLAGETYQVRARYVVAADGGRNSTELLGVQMQGPRSLVDVVSLYVEADLSEYADESALLTYFVNPDAKATVPGALLSLSPGPLARDSPEWTISIKFRLDDPLAHDEEGAVEHARRLLGLPDLPMAVKAIGHWQYEGLVAERFRVGSVFLTGDAAHRHPPTGGLGLNTAVQDAANLAWKLAAVLKGHAPPSLLDSYEQERMPVAAFNVAHSLRNAGRHAPIGEAMGLRPEQSTEEGWAQVALWASDTPEGAARREDVWRAIEHNSEDYSQLNVEAGFFYESGAVVPDGSPPPSSVDSATEFVAVARPGHHLPHAWLERVGGENVSTIDMVSLSGLTLFVGTASAAVWKDGANTAAEATGCPLSVVVIGDAGDFVDRDGEYAELIGIVDGGALLVRPDKHIAWQQRTAPADPEGTLRAALVQVLSGTGQPSPSANRDRLTDISEAGEVLRSGVGRSSRRFEDIET